MCPRAHIPWCCLARKVSVEHSFRQGLILFILKGSCTTSHSQLFTTRTPSSTLSYQTVLEGSARVLVLAVGVHSQQGKINALLVGHEGGGEPWHRSIKGQHSSKQDSLNWVCG